jgi:hypothetical protein
MTFRGFKNDVKTTNFSLFYQFSEILINWPNRSSLRMTELPASSGKFPWKILFLENKIVLASKKIISNYKNF